MKIVDQSGAYNTTTASGGAEILQERKASNERLAQRESSRSSFEKRPVNLETPLPGRYMK